MSKRFVTIWFPHLKTDWFTIRQPLLQDQAFVLAFPDHGRMMVGAANIHSEQQGIHYGMALADARVLLPSLYYFDDRPRLPAYLLKKMAEWCIRFAPVVAVDEPDGIILDASGCAPLWGSDAAYLTDIYNRFIKRGYDIRLSMADTIGAAWAMTRFGPRQSIIPPGEQMSALLSLPPASLRLEPGVPERLQKLGIRQIGNLIGISRSALRRRFGELLLLRLDQALGSEAEIIQPVEPILPFVERLPSLEPIVTATGIEIALERLLETLCKRLQQEGKGLRTASFNCYRVDGRIEKIEIGTNRASHNPRHLSKLFSIRLPDIEPALGIELFILEALKTEECPPIQEKLWVSGKGWEDAGLLELMDRLSNKMGSQAIHRYLPAEHHWPERSYQQAATLSEKKMIAWKDDQPRPIQILSKPQPIEVSAPIPDYPPMLFRYKGKLHIIKKADGPERIEREWWLDDGPHRDYYIVEDERGQRYWLFRSGHYSIEKKDQWFLHGFFA